MTVGNVSTTDDGVGTAVSNEKEYTFNEEFANDMDKLADDIVDLASKEDSQFSNDASDGELVNKIDKFLDEADSALIDKHRFNPQGLNTNSAQYLSAFKVAMRSVLADALDDKGDTNMVERYFGGFSDLVAQFQEQPAPVAETGGSGTDNATGGAGDDDLSDDDANYDMSEASSLLTDAKDADTSDEKADLLSEAIEAIIAVLNGGEGGTSGDGGSDVPPETGGDGDMSGLEAQADALGAQIDALSAQVTSLLSEAVENSNGPFQFDTNDIENVSADELIASGDGLFVQAGNLMKTIENLEEDLAGLEEIIETRSDETEEVTEDTGDDTVTGGSGDDTLDGGAGDDMIEDTPAVEPQTEIVTERLSGDALMGKMNAGGAAITFDDSDGGLGVAGGGGGDDEIGRGEKMTFQTGERFVGGEVELVDLFADKGGKGQEVATINVYDGDNLVDQIQVNGDMDGNQTARIDQAFDRLEFVIDGENGDSDTDFAIGAVSVDREQPVEGGGDPVTTPGGSVDPSTPTNFDATQLIELLQALASVSDLVDSAAVSNDYTEEDKSQIQDLVGDVMEQIVGATDGDEQGDASVTVAELVNILSALNALLNKVRDEVPESDQKAGTIDAMTDGTEAITEELSTVGQ